MIDLDEMIRRLEELKENGTPGDTPVLIDCGQYLTEVEEIDLDANTEDVIIWCGDLAK